MRPVPASPIPTRFTRLRRPCADVAVGTVLSAHGSCQLLGNPVEHAPMDAVRVFLPAEDADRSDAVELQVAQGAEELGPVDLPVADLVVLVDAGVYPRRVDDV